MLFAVSCSSDDRPSGANASSASASAHSSGPEVVAADADFYRVPDPFPAGKPGDLVRVQQVASTSFQRATVWRVMYHSQSLAGNDIAVTGLVAIPAGAAPSGGRNIVSWAHGTTGIADKCAPSQTPAHFDIAVLGQAFLDEGDIFAATDYEGLGTPGRHPYIVGVSEGRGVIDVVRAARQLPDAGAGDRYAVWGHSQGGHAALFANQIAAQWAPELHLVGTVAGAPASELPLLATVLSAVPDQTLTVMVAAGWNAAFPDADLHAVLTDEALRRIDVVDTGCSNEIGAAFAGLRYHDVIKADINTVPVWKDLPVENDPGHAKSDAPLFVIHGTADTTIPAAASQLLVSRLCSLGQVVLRKTYEGASHGGVVAVAFDDTKQWIDDRFAGKPAPNGC